MRRLAVLGLLLVLASTAWAQLPVGRVIPTDNWAIGHITGVVHVAGTVQLSGGHSLVASHISSVTHVVLLASGHANVIRDHISSSLRTSRVANCGTTVATAVASNPNRRDLYLQNLGGPSVSGVHNNLYLGYGVQGHVALTINNGWVLHSAAATGAGSTPGSPLSQVIIYNYQGPISCISADAGGINLSIMEILR